MDNLSNSTEPQTEPVKLPKFGSSQPNVAAEPSLLDMQTAVLAADAAAAQALRALRGRELGSARQPMMNGMHAHGRSRGSAAAAILPRWRCEIHSAAAAMNAAAGRWRAQQRAEPVAAEHQPWMRDSALIEFALPREMA